ncbi:hypothetical protein AB0H98_32115 [Nocardia salmonicida]|uniref:hypothetical protein n=1 Tax=Nocardia salmonicida TaxID=53431 RepID=UPI0033D65B89
MHAIGSRRRSQPAPTHAVFAALTNPDRDPTRPWLILLTDEQRPEVLESTYPNLVIWTTLWPKHPTAQASEDVSDADTIGCNDWSAYSRLTHVEDRVYILYWSVGLYDGELEQKYGLDEFTGTTRTTFSLP